MKKVILKCEYCEKEETVEIPNGGVYPRIGQGIDNQDACEECHVRARNYLYHLKEQKKLTPPISGK